MARGFDFGKFAEVLGEHGVQFGKQLTKRKEAADRAPMDKLNLELLQQEVQKGRFAIDEKKTEAARKKNLDNKLKTLRNLLQEPEVQKEITQKILEQQGETVGPPVPETTQRQPTLGEQVQRLRGTEFEFPSDPAIQKQVEGLRGRFAAQQQPMLEQEEFERTQEGKKDILSFKSDLERKTLAEKELRDRKKTENQPIFDTLSEKEKTYVFDANSTFQNLDNVMSIVDKLDEGKLKGFIRAVQGKVEVLKDPEVQKLYSAYQMLTGAITKQIQGARPSDYDAIKYEMATGQRSISKENMKAALGMIGKYVSAQTNSVRNTISKGYSVEPSVIDGLFSDTVHRYLGGNTDSVGLTPDEERELEELEREFGGGD